MRTIIRPNEFESTQKMKFTKTETEYNMKSIRFLLLTITTMFILIGALMIVLGVSVYSHYHSFVFFYESTKTGRFFTPSIMSVITGMVILVVTSFGFFGSLKKSTCMVNVYALLLTIILIIKLVVVIVAFTVDGSTIIRYVSIPISEYGSDPEIRDEIDSLQIRLSCCGSDSFMDYHGIEFPDNRTVVYNKPSGVNISSIELPVTCCATDDGQACVRIRQSGCKESLINAIVQNSNVLGVLGVSVMFIQFLGIIFAVLLARCIRKLKSEKALMSWKVKEQMILARQAERNKTSIYLDHPDTSVA